MWSGLPSHVQTCGDLPLLLLVYLRQFTWLKIVQNEKWNEKKVFSSQFNTQNFKLLAKMQSRSSFSWKDLTNFTDFLFAKERKPLLVVETGQASQTATQTCQNLSHVYFHHQSKIESSLQSESSFLCFISIHKNLSYNPKYSRPIALQIYLIICIYRQN